MHQQQIQQNQHTQNIQLPQTTTATATAKPLPQKKTQQQQVEPKNQNRSIYTGNLHVIVTENDLHDFFGLRSLKHLHETRSSFMQ